MPANPLVGYFRLNRERLKREMTRRGIASEAELRRQLEGAVSQATMSRMIYDNVNPSSSAMFALSTLLCVRVEDLFDPVSGEAPTSRPESTRECLNMRMSNVSRNLRAI